ncbi:LexA/Signal peptidase [Piedraia hortae CBS 480.64]|uniref:Mitochondrial inner membrane protease subunit n=1 Tax=Piedraia hortae CBS 480.64 TaxID=1314780 RepID=A0A6A7C265_9PEZI|nr:LexA/Signal peptidase [Piedraia hortae CBS 480.64]
MPSNSLSRGVSLLRAPFWALTLTLLLTTHGVDITLIRGTSMVPTLPSGSLILWNRHKPTQNLERGALVEFYSPAAPETSAVKRVVALAGDEVTLDSGRRPKRVRDGDENRRWDALGGRVRIPEGHVWVEGDNRSLSRDSNWYGPVSMGMIRGKAVCLLWPWREIGRTPWVGFKSQTGVTIR